MTLLVGMPVTVTVTATPVTVAASALAKRQGVVPAERLGNCVEGCEGGGEVFFSHRARNLLVEGEPRSLELSDRDVGVYAQSLAHLGLHQFADDARKTRIVVTGAGAQVVLRMREQRSAAVSSALESFSEEDQRQLATLLTRLADAWPERPSGSR